MTLAALLAYMSTITQLINAGKMVVTDLEAFLASHGADQAQLAANRALLVNDVASIDAELAALNPPKP